MRVDTIEVCPLTAQKSYEGKTPIMHGEKDEQVPFSLGSLSHARRIAGGLQSVRSPCGNDTLVVIGVAREPIEWIAKCPSKPHTHRLNPTPIRPNFPCGSVLRESWQRPAGSLHSRQRLALVHGHSCIRTVERRRWVGSSPLSCSHQHSPPPQS